MTGSAAYSRSEDAAAVARERLDAVATALAAVEEAQRCAFAELVELWPTSAWLAAGATSPKRWLLTYTSCSDQEAHRLERLAGLCHRHPALAEAVRTGHLSMAWAHTLGTAANPDREAWLADSLPAFLRLAERGCDDADWAGAVRHWASLVDQEREVRRVPAHSVAADTFDGFCPTDGLDEQLASDDDLDPLVVLRRRLRKAEAHRRRRSRRRTRSRSAACVNVHIDLRTLAGLRALDDFEDLVLRGDGWNLTRAAAEQLLCDSALTAVLFDGKGTLLDANDAAEQWSRKQRRAIAARDGGCVFPGCGRPPRHCDIHHLHHRNRGGPTRTANGAMLCRFHHRLLHHHGWRLLVEAGRWVAVDAHGTRWTGRPTPLASGDPP